MAINLTQKFIFETDSIKSLQDVMYCIMRVIFQKPVNVGAGYSQMYITNYHPTSKILNKKDFFVCSIKSYADDMDLGYCTDYGQNWSEANFRKIIKDATGRLKAITESEAREVIGSGYDNHVFMRSDGDIEIGYRIEVEHSLAWEYLNLSIVNIYYGK